jgi:predicted transposase YbfD/YdcC
MLGKPAWDFNRFVTDPRQKKGQRWKFKTLMESLRFGFLTNRSSLRKVETMTEMGFDKRVPDSTLYDLVGQFEAQEVAALRTQLHAQIKREERSKSLEPVGLPCGVAAVDNKTLWSGTPEEAKDPEAQVVHPQGRPPYATLRAVRTVLLSAAAKPALDQVVIPARTNEGGVFPAVLTVLEANYGALIEVYSMDAGFCAKTNADRIAAARKGYIFGLKGNQPELCKEAGRWLGSRTAPEISTCWERSQGDSIRYHLYRTAEMGGAHGWSHLQQVWRIEKEIKRGKTGAVERENHYYVTNLDWDRFKPEQLLLVVRAHWGSENNCNWTMDVIWEEDTKVWCGQGLGIRVLGLLRLMAYNLVAHLRCRYLRQRDHKAAAKRRWKEWCEALLLVLAGITGAEKVKVGLSGN